MIPTRYRYPVLRLARLAAISAGVCMLLTAEPNSLAQFSGPATSSTSGYNQALVPTVDPAILYPGERDVVLTVGDNVSIRLFSDAKYNSQVRINNDGTVLLPLIGIVHLEGLSITQAERLIAQKLEDDGMYRNPQVTLQITEGPTPSSPLSAKYMLWSQLSAPDTCSIFCRSPAACRPPRVMSLQSTVPASPNPSLSISGRIPC